MGTRRRGRWPGLEGLEGRTLQAASLAAGPVVDVAPLRGNQSEPAIAINPTNPANLVVWSNQNAPATTARTPGIVSSVSFDGGATWTTQTLADGFGSLVPACCDPSLAFDASGNLFGAYLDDSGTLVPVVLSTDGGRTFTALTTFDTVPHQMTHADQPTIATGPGSVWVLYKSADNALVTAGAPVHGPGAVGPFGAPNPVPGSAEGNFGDLSVGPQGQVLVSYQVPTGDLGPSNLLANLDPDGLGGTGFGPPVVVPPAPSPLLPDKTSTTFVGGFMDIPAQPVRTIDAEVGLAYDTSDGPHRGRVYLVYTDASALRSPDTDIYLRSSDDNGATWSAPVRVNDDATHNSQFFPRLAVDPMTGHVGVSWYDARNDPGSGPGDLDGLANDDVETFATVSLDGGQTFLPNLQVSPGPSSAARAGHNSKNDFGDYSGLAFFADTLYPAWASNSPSLAANPEPTTFDTATARVSLVVPVPLSGGLAGPSGAMACPGVTDADRPTFSGTTAPGATVQVLAQGPGLAAPMPVGQSVAGPDGAWSVTAAPLPSGTYTFLAVATDAAGHTSPAVPLLSSCPGGVLVIDTTGPVVLGATFDPRSARIRLTVADDRSGVDTASLLDPTNYLVTRSRPRAGASVAITALSLEPPAVPGAPPTVLLTLDHGRRLRGGAFLLRVRSGGVRDLAGNPLDGEFFGYFPTGDRLPGGDFTAQLDALHGVTFPPRPTADPPSPTRLAATSPVPHLRASSHPRPPRRGPGRRA